MTSPIFSIERLQLFVVVANVIYVGMMVIYRQAALDEDIYLGAGK